MSSISSLGSTIDSFIKATSTDFTTILSTVKTGLPTDPNQINAIVLAALRILSISLITASSVLGFSAMHMNQIAQLTSIFPTILAPALTAIIVFHDLYVGASNITNSLNLPTADTSAASVETAAVNLTATSALTFLSASIASAPKKVLPMASNEQKVGSQFRKPHQIRFRSGKTLQKVLNEGATSFATEVTTNMWALRWILIKTDTYWTPMVAKRFYNVSFPDKALISA